MSDISKIVQEFCDYKYCLNGNTKKTISWYKYTFHLFIKESQVSSVDNCYDDPCQNEN